MSDLIERQVAIDSLHMHLMYRMGTDSNKKRLDEWINSLPSAQPDISDISVEIEAEYKKWVNVPYINKPLAKALYEVRKKYDKEDVERGSDETDYRKE